MKTPRIYSLIPAYVPLKILQPTIDREERPCACYEDPMHCRTYELDGTVAFSATPVMVGFESDIMIRAERACGLVMYFLASTHDLDRIEGDRFWSVLFRRPQKQCESLYRYPQPESERDSKKKPKQDRNRASGQWRSRRS